MGEPLVVGAREFKTRLGTYLRRVREGRILTITDRGRPVAEVMPIGSAGRSVDAHLARLRRQGVVSGQAKSVGADRQAEHGKRPGAIEMEYPCCKWWVLIGVSIRCR